MPLEGLRHFGDRVLISAGITISHRQAHLLGRITLCHQQTRTGYLDHRTRLLPAARLRCTPTATHQPVASPNCRSAMPPGCPRILLNHMFLSGRVYWKDL